VRKPDLILRADEAQAVDVAQQLGGAPVDDEVEDRLVRFAEG
jgi:hypothetical protein